MNIAYNNSLTWAHDSLTHIESQLLIPLFGDNPIELGAAGHEQQILARLTQAPYPALFQAAYADSQADFRRVVDALASFSRSLLSFNSRFDRYAYQQDDRRYGMAYAQMNVHFCVTADGIMIQDVQQRWQHRVALRFAPPPA